MNDIPSRLQELLDAAAGAGRDPVDDPALQQWLAAHPGALEPFARLRADLAAIAAATPHAAAPPAATLRPAAPARPWRAAGLAAAALLLGAIGVALWPTSAAPAPAPRSGPLPRPLLAPAGLVRQCATRVRAAGDGRTFLAATQFGAATQRHRRTLVVQPITPPAVRACTTTVTLEQTLLP